MRSFFRNLEKHGVRYLLISGQASVLYGASTFSEDIDLWISPTALNVRALTSALRESRAVVYKLTPPLRPSYFRRGHGFHFLVPSRPAPVYLDIMGKPPRVPAFGAVCRRATWWDTDWGRIPAVAIPDLVQLKKTRRLSDYDTISNLVRIRLLTTTVRVSAPDLRWALQNCFRIEDAQWILSTWHPPSVLLREIRRPWVNRLSRATIAPSVTDLGTIQGLIMNEIGRLQKLDIQYWSPIIRELKEMRRKGMLLPEGTPV